MNQKMKQACLAVADVFEFAPECWAADEYALTAEGKVVWGENPAACKWCAQGGLQAVLGNYDYAERVTPTLNAIARDLGYFSALHANDDGGRKVAIKMLRIAGQP